MNYLGHLVLSGRNKQVLFGNFIADSIKGNSYLNWPKKIQKGILLHRHIDHFTDNNIYFLKGKRRFYVDFPKLGGIINDIIYDYLLWQYDLKYQSINLSEEIKRFYRVLDDFKIMMPENIRHMYSYMRRDDWLLSYQTISGIKMALNGIGLRTKYSNNLSNAFDLVEKDMDNFNNEFELFYKQIKTEVSTFL